MLDIRSIQFALAKYRHYAGAVDGLFGPASQAARDEALEALGLDISKWKDDRRMLAIEQWTMARSGIPVTVDGLLGPDTRHARDVWQTMVRNTTAKPALVAHMPTTFPRQADAQEFYGKPGENHTLLTLPYPFRLAWEPKTVVEKITINKKCSASAERALKAALDHYGHDQLKTLGLDLFGGCFNNRNMRGGRRLSMHAYACAIDIDPDHNQLRWGSDRARMAGADYAPFLDAFEAEGWISLGRERNFDWQHLQAARL